MTPDIPLTDGARPPLIAALMNPKNYPHPTGDIRLLETHISWVILTGEFAYKIKKPVHLGFLNFLSLQARRYYCEKELELNRRLAGDLYLEVVAIRGTPSAPRMDGQGPTFEYAIKMREFPQQALANGLLSRGELGTGEIEALAAIVARFHQNAARVRPDARYGAPALVLAPAIENFEQIAPLLETPADHAALNDLRVWTERAFIAREDDFASRRRDGFVRECHGDLHLGNIAVINEQPVVFDCIEFNEDLRWIDVMSEIAFVMMDLEDHGRGDLAWRFVNRYFEATGDYAGLGVLRFYRVYRAIVRAKVHALRASQSGAGTDEAKLARSALRDYLKLALRFTRPPRPALVITHGLTGSGKTTASLALADRLEAIRLRSDLECQRMPGPGSNLASGVHVAEEIRPREADAGTYRRLASQSHDALDADCSVVADANFLRRWDRAQFRAIATQRNVPFLILDVTAPEDVLRARVADRSARVEEGPEAALAALDRQITTQEILAPDETAAAITIDGTQPPSAERWQPVIERLKRAAPEPARTAVEPVAMPS